MNERVKRYLEALVYRHGSPLVPCVHYAEIYGSQSITNYWRTKAFIHDNEPQAFIGAVVLTHGLLIMPWGRHEIYVELYAIGETGAFKGSMNDALIHCNALWMYATSTPIGEVLKNKRTQFYIDNENLFIAMSRKYNKEVKTQPL